MKGFPIKIKITRLVELHESWVADNKPFVQVSEKLSSYILTISWTDRFLTQMNKEGEVLIIESIKWSRISV